MRDGGGGTNYNILPDYDTKASENCCQPRGTVGNCDICPLRSVRFGGGGKQNTDRN